MDGPKDTGVEAILEHLIEHGANDLATVFARAFERANLGARTYHKEAVVLRLHATPRAASAEEAAEFEEAQARAKEVFSL